MKTHSTNNSKPSPVCVRMTRRFKGEAPRNYTRQPTYLDIQQSIQDYYAERPFTMEKDDDSQ